MKGTMIALLTLVVMWPALGGARTPEQQRMETLRALPGVYFVVEGLGDQLQQEGLETSAIQRDVEFQLRQAGIRIMTEPEWSMTPGKPFLYVRVSTVKKEDHYAFHLSVEMFQAVRLERFQELAPVQVPTWRAREEIGMIEAGQVKELRQYLAEQIHQFIEAFRAVNST